MPDKVSWRKVRIYSKVFGEFATDLLKLTGIFSFLLGLILLLSYLISEGAPLPTSDLPIGGLLSLICLVFVFSTVIFGSVLLLPALTYMFTYSKQKEKEQSTFGSGIRSYVVSFSTYHFSWVLILVWLSVRRFDWLFLSFLAMIWSVVPSVQKERPRWNILVNNGASFVPFITLLPVIVGALSKSGIKVSDPAIVLGSVLILVGIHFFTVRVITNWKEAGLVYLMLVWVAVTVIPGSAFLGALALRVLGIGGGIPVSVELNGPTIQVAGVGADHSLHGCLVLLTGSEVLLRPTQRPSDCKLHTSLLFETPVYVQPYSSIRLLKRADVIQISKFPDTCGTVDGLPSC